MDEMEKRRRGEGRASAADAVVERLALEAGEIKWTGKPIAIFDIDGTLADTEWRRAFAKGGACPFGPHKKGANCRYCGGTGRVKKNWGTFFRLAIHDKPVQDVAEWARRTYEQGQHEVVIVSGRPDTYGDDTIAWLGRHGVQFHHIFMRRGHDKRPDTQVKREILERLPYQRLAFIVDDRPSVLRMWDEFRRQHQLSYEIHDVGSGEEF